MKILNYFLSFCESTNVFNSTIKGRFWYFKILSTSLPFVKFMVSDII